MKKTKIKTLSGGGTRSLLLSFFVAMAMVICSAGVAKAAVTYDVQWTEWDPTTGVLTLKAGKSGTEGVPTATSGNVWLCDEADDGWQKRKYGKTDFKTLYPFSNSNSVGIGDGIYKLVKRFVVDKSYKEFPTKSINFFFRDMENLELVEGLEYIRNISNLDTYTASNGERGSLCRLFKGCKNLKFIQGMETWSGYPTQLFEMFSGCEKLLWVDISKLYTSSVENMDNMFYDCKSMRKAWVGYSDFSQFYHGSYNNMFANCTYVDGLFDYLPGDKKAEEYVVYYDGILAFFNDRHRMSTSRYAYIYDLNEGTNHTGWYDRRFLIETVWFAKNCKYTIPKNGYGYYPSDYFNEPVNAKTCFEWFCDCIYLKDIYGWKNVTISNATSMAYMFSGCKQLTSKAINDLIQTSGYISAKDLSYMFNACSGLRGSISFDKGGTWHYSLFNDLVQNLSHMFSGCSNLTSINFGYFSGYNVENTKSMFEGCSSLERIFMYDKNPSVSKITNSTNMFKGCTNLKGGSGTKYDANHTDITYARIDRPSLSYSYKGPGYLSTYSSVIDCYPNFGGITDVYFADTDSRRFTMDDADFTRTVTIGQWVYDEGYQFKDIICYGGNTSVNGRTITVKKGSCSDIYCLVRLKCPLKHVDLEKKSTPYTGNKISITLSCYLNDAKYTLVENTDYVVQYIKIKKGDTYENVSEIKQAGRYQLTLYGKGDNFTSAYHTFEFTVSPLELTVVPKSTTKTYSDPDPEIPYTIEGGTLVSGDKLTGSLSYNKSAGENVGKHTITIGSLNNPNYNITLADGEFEILPKKLANAVVLTTSSKYPYTGAEIKPAVFVFDGENKIPASEYSVSYRNNIDLGQGIVNVTDNPGGNYEVSGSGSFTIADPSDFCEVAVKYHGFSSSVSKTYYVITGQILPYGDLSEEGYSLLGLYTDDGCNTPFDYKNTPISSNGITLHAKWQINKHKLLLKVDGTEIVNQMLEFGTPISIPTQQAVEGKTFSWNMDIPMTMPDYDIEAEGAYITNKHTITYIIDGEVYHKDEMIDYGTPITILNAPMQSGYKFSGWTPASLPETMPDKDINVTGSFEPNKHYFYLSYINPDGVEQKIQEEVAYGTKIKDLLPKFTGYVFISNNDILETMPDKNYTLSGKYELGKYTLTYLLNGKEHKTIENLTYNTPISPLAAPAVEAGYYFTGWEGEPKTMPDIDLVVRGYIKGNEHTITYMLNGEVYKTVKAEYGSKITLPTTPFKAGFTFSGWNELPETMPDNDLTVTGSLTKNGTTPVASIPENADEAKVWSYNGTIYIETLPDTKYTITDLNGRILTTSTTKSTHDEIQLNVSGILIVTLGKHSFKVMN